MENIIPKEDILEKENVVKTEIDNLKQWNSLTVKVLGISILTVLGSIGALYLKQTEIITDVAVLKQDLEYVKEDMREIKDDIKEIKQLLREMNKK